MLLQLVLCKHASAEYKTNVMRTKTQYTIFSVRILMFVVLALRIFAGILL